MSDKGKKHLVGLGACLLFIEKQRCLSHVTEKENLHQQTAGLMLVWMLAISLSLCLVVRLTSDNLKKKHLYFTYFSCF